MRDTSIPSNNNKVCAAKAGSTMRARSPVASSPTKLSLLPAVSLPIPFLTSAIRQRRSVSFTCDSFDIMSRESVESIEQVGNTNTFTSSDLQENSARIPLQPRSLPSFITATPPHTQFPSFPSPLKISKANIAPKSNNVRKTSALLTEEIRLNIRPKELDASSVRELGLQLFLTKNADLPFLPEVDGECRENTPTMCLTPISSQSLAQFSSPPVLQRTEECSSHAASLAMHCGLFVPDDF
jgi:hypothetical protein